MKHLGSCTWLLLVAGAAWSQTDPAQPGVEVQARGPVHEAFATPSQDLKATVPVAKKPPAPLDELPPEDRPEGEVAWIGGYWAFDDDRQDFLWVSGCWRAKPQDKDWVPGYWRESSGSYQWISGFWTNTAEGQPAAQVTYLPEPPAPPNLAPPGEAPAADQFYVPGYWLYVGDRYAWRAGYWTRSRPGHVYVSSHYRWSPYGHVFVAGYWDYHVAGRGVLYAPVHINYVAVGPRFVYTPYYAVHNSVVVDFLFVRAGHGHYYFGDYYGPRYATLGFECGYAYGRRHYDPIVAYRRWEHRDQPRWIDARVSLTIERSAGRAPLPPRTLVQQNTVVNNVTNVKNVTINNTQIIAPTRTVAKGNGGKAVAVDAGTRAQALSTTKSLNRTSEQRQSAEVAPPKTGFGGPSQGKPKVAQFNLPATTPGPKGVKPQPMNPMGQPTINSVGTKPQPMGPSAVKTQPQPMGPSAVKTQPQPMGPPAVKTQPAGPPKVRPQPQPMNPGVGNPPNRPNVNSGMLKRPPTPMGRPGDKKRP